MYQLIRARHRLNRRSGRWTDVDLTNANLNTLSTVYGDVLLYITYPGNNETFVVKFEDTIDLRRGASATLTVQQWLTGLGNTTLPISDTPSERIDLVEYAQAWHSGYDVNTRSRNGHLINNTSAHEHDDLIITHPKFSPGHIDKHALFTVNGFIHLSDYGTDGVRVVDGNRTIRKGNDNQIGVISFEKVGEIQKYPITPDMLFKQNAETKLFDTTYLKLPGDVDLTGKTVLLVLGGYLQVLGKTYFRVNDNIWRIMLGDILFLERYFESVYNMDMSSLGLTTDPDNQDRFSVDEMRCDRVMEKYLTCSQSFLVIVDVDSMFHELEPLEYTGFYGRYLNRHGKQLPMVGCYGRTLDYHVIKEHGYYVYSAPKNIRYNYLARTGNWLAMSTVNDGLYSAAPTKDGEAFLRVMGVER